MESSLPLIARARAVLRALFVRRRVEAELDDELRFHIESEVQARVRGGMSADAARTTALRDFGGIDRIKEECRDEWGTRLAEELGRDAGYSVRALRRNPGFAIVASLTIALGVGAATTIFSVARAVLRPLPYAASDRLVVVRTVDRGADDATSALDFLDWRRQSSTLEALAAVGADPMNLTGAGEPERLLAAAVSGNIHALLRAQPLAGRLLRDGDDAAGASRVVVLGEGLWRRRFAADGAVVGRTVSLDGQPYVVVGVVPDREAYPQGADLYVPLVFPSDDLEEDNRGARYYRVIARLAPGATLRQAREEMRTITGRMAAAHPRALSGTSARVAPLLDDEVGRLRQPLLILLAAAGVLLLVACANVANLLLVRAAGRDTEMAVRTALGAPRARLVRQLATESILPFAAGGAAGVALAALGTRAFRQAAGDTIPRLGEASVDVTALAFALGLTLATGIVFGVLPAVRFTVPRVAVALRAGRGPRASRERARARSFIVASEVALATLLLASAGLLVRSFQELTAVDPGFRREGVMSFRLELPRTRYADHASVRAFAAALDDRLRQLPGARATGRVVRTPIDQYDFSVGFTIDGRPLPPGERRPVAQVRIASAGYFETMGIRLARGRTFSPRDDAQAPQVVVVNRAMAERYFPGEDPLGERVWLGWSEDGVTRGGEIVGIIENVRQFALDRPAEPELYVAFDQAPVRQMSVVVRSSAEPAALFAAARAAVRDLDPELPLFAFTTLEEKVSRSAARPRLYMSLVAAFALVALALAAIGLYGVVSYGVRQRTQELGVRMALGASPASVVRLVVGGSLRLTLIGALTGIVAAFGATDAMRSLLFGVSPADPWTYAGVFVLLAGVGALASWLPAWRATRIDPVTALRAE